jgi:MFS family permease
MGYYGMAMNLAMTIGPALGAALIGSIGFSGLFWLSSAIALASLLLVQTLREPARPQAHGPSSRTRSEHPPLFSRVALLPGFVSMCMTMTFGAIVSFLPLFVQRHNLGNPGVFFTVYSIAVVVSRPLSGRLSDRLGRAAIIIPGMLLVAASMVILAYNVSTSGLLWTAILQGLGFGAVHPAIMALVVDRSTMHDRGPALATLMMAFDIGMGIGAVGLGQVLEYTSFTVMYLCTAGIALVGAAAVVATIPSHQKQ